MKFKLYQQAVIGTYITEDKIVVLHPEESETLTDKVMKDSFRNNNMKSLHMTYDGEIDSTRFSLTEYVLEEIFIRFNADDRPTGKYSTSLTIGDVVLLDGLYYECSMAGFKKVDIRERVKS